MLWRRPTLLLQHDLHLKDCRDCAYFHHVQFLFFAQASASAQLCWCDSLPWHFSQSFLSKHWSSTEPLMDTVTDTPSVSPPLSLHCFLYCAQVLWGNWCFYNKPCSYGNKDGCLSIEDARTWCRQQFSRFYLPALSCGHCLKSELTSDVLYLVP